MGWLEKLTTWLKDTIAAIFEALVTFVHDAGLWIFKQGLALVAWVADHFPVPDFISTYNFQGLFDAMGPTAGWVMTWAQIPLCFTILGAGIGFRLLRKLLTLGQW